VELILLFGLINKVAGVYGLIAIFTGGSITQLSFYLYSTATLFLFIWGMKAVSEESSSRSLTLAHLYTFDHILQTLYTLNFANYYWYGVAHDGMRIANSPAQQALIELAISRGEITAGRSEDIAALAQQLWTKERGTAALVLILIWFMKIYFIVVLYSFAAHLRSKTYHSLPLSSSDPDPRVGSQIEQYASTAPTPSHGQIGRSKMQEARKVEQAEGEDEFQWDSDGEDAPATNNGG